MFGNQGMNERLPVVGQISPASYSAGEQLTAAIDMKNFRRLLVLVQTGVLGASATLDVKATASSTSGGTYTDISGRVLTQIVKASGDNKLAILEITAEQVGAHGASSRYVKISATVGTAASIFGVVVLADGLRYSDAAENDLAAVVQVK